MAFCTECGVNAPEGVSFCTGCGSPMDGATRPQAVTAPPPVYTPPPVYPPPQSYANPAEAGDSAVLGTGAFIGFTILFAIPLVGWFACILLSFAGGNLNRRNYARSRLFFMIVGVIFAIVAYFVLSWIFGALFEYLNEVSNGEFTESGGLKGILEILN